MRSIERLPIDKIRLDGGTQPRAVLDFGAIDDYSEAIAAGSKFPPVTVFYDGEDGFHRVKATFAAECDTIECEVHQGTLEDAQWFSYSANKNHGLRRTNSDKQRAIRAALLHRRSWELSDRRIARHLGVDAKTIASWRAQLTEEIPQSIHRTGKDGRTINVDGIRESNKARRGKRRCPASEPDNQEREPANPSTTEPRSTRAKRIDRVSRLIVSFLENTKRLAGLIGWLGETAGEFDRAEEVLARVGEPIASSIAQIEQRALAADPLNASRLGIGEGA